MVRPHAIVYEILLNLDAAVAFHCRACCRTIHKSACHLSSCRQWSLGFKPNNQALWIEPATKAYYFRRRFCDIRRDESDFHHYRGRRAALEWSVQYKRSTDTVCSRRVAGADLRRGF